MRPIKLTLSGFGPYSGETEIDFEKLLLRADRALYLSKRRKNIYTVLDYDAREVCGELPH